MAIDFTKLSEQRMQDDKTLYLILSGDKAFGLSTSLTMKVNGEDTIVTGVELYNALVQKLINKRLNDGFKIVVRCGWNAGADILAQDWAKRNKCEVDVHKPNWDKKGPSAGYSCAEDMFTFTGIKRHKGCFLLWDGEDKMTRYLIFCSWLYGVPCRVWNYIEKRWCSGSEIEDVAMAVRKEQLSFGRNV